MKIGIISGSHRLNSESEKIAKYIQTELKNKQQETFLVTLANNPFPLWDEGKWGKESENNWGELWGKTSRELKTCDGFVVISPEWSGMAAPGLKNFFLLCDKQELAFKPGYIVGVSSSRGGSYPIAELRMSSYKNTRITYLPEHLIVRDCQSMFNPDPVTETNDEYLRARLNFGLDLLVEYSKAMEPIRNQDFVINSKYNFGL